MLSYAVVEISGRQYKVVPGKTYEVDYLGEKADFECDKVMMISTGENLEIGTPFLTSKLKFVVVDTIKKPKVRVATFKAKANTRKLIGSRRQVTRIKLEEVAAASKKAA